MMAVSKAPVRKIAIRWRLVAALGLAYVLVSAAAVGGLMALRASVLAQESSPAAIESWQRWKAESQRSSREAGPVARRPVTSNEPPGLILLRDYFAKVAGAVLVIISGIFGFLVIVLWSRLRGGGAPA
jgi:hypothetical protein